MKFQPDVHTHEARETQLKLIAQEHPEALLIGSVARAALLGGAASVNKGYLGRTVRDLDVTTTNGFEASLTQEEQYPFPVDNAIPQLVQVSENEDKATVMYDVRRPDVSVEMPASLFAPYPIMVGCVALSTYHPDTMRHLHLIQNNRRPKDAASLSNFEKALQSVDYTKIPDREFDPLYELVDMVLADPALRRQRAYERMHAVYLRKIPVSVRSLGRPLVRAVKHAKGIHTRDELASVATQSVEG